MQGGPHSRPKLHAKDVIQTVLATRDDAKFNYDGKLLGETSDNGTEKPKKALSLRDHKLNAPGPLL